MSEKIHRAGEFSTIPGMDGALGSILGTKKTERKSMHINKWTICEKMLSIFIYLY